MGEEMLHSRKAEMHRVVPGSEKKKTDFNQKNQELDGFEIEEESRDFAQSDGDNNATRKGNTFVQNVEKKRKTIFTAVQKQELEEVFHNYHYPSRWLCKQLAEKFDTSYSSIKIWFKNHRARRTKRATTCSMTPNPNYSVYPWSSFCSPCYQSHGYIPLSHSHTQQPSGLNPLECLRRLSVSNRLLTTRETDHNQRRSAFSLYRKEKCKTGSQESNFE